MVELVGSSVRLGPRSYGHLAVAVAVFGGGVRICYIDESGDAAVVPAARSSIQPVLTIVGLVGQESMVRPFTREFIQLKRRFFPGLRPSTSQPLDWILAEVKGSEIRRSAVSHRRRESRQALGFLDRLMEMLDEHEVRVVGRVWVKAIAKPIDQWAIYTFSMQAICVAFQHHLDAEDDHGVVVADSRSPAQNIRVAHSIFTQRFAAAGDPYPRILEMPTFGHSDNHALLQAADLVASALVFPMASRAYCHGILDNLHVRPEYDVLLQRYGATLRRLQHRYQDIEGRWVGGLTVDDRLAQRGGALLFGGS